MGGYIRKKVNEKIHNEDRCSSYENKEFDQYTCAEYLGGNTVYQCSGHRNLDISRTMDLANYGKGSVIRNSGSELQYSKLSVALQSEIDARQQHIWYKEDISDFSCAKVDSGDLVKHEQENAINNAIDALNGYINTIHDGDLCADWGISRKDDTSARLVGTGADAEAENLKYLERNVLAAWRDCICYSDCTVHGISSYTKRVWCSGNGEESGNRGFYY